MNQSFNQRNQTCVLGRLHDAGMPRETPTFNTTLCEESRGLADKWTSAAASGTAGPADTEPSKFDAWPSPQKVWIPRGGDGGPEGKGRVDTLSLLSSSSYYSVYARSCWKPWRTVYLIRVMILPRIVHMRHGCMSAQGEKNGSPNRRRMGGLSRQGIKQYFTEY